MANNLDPLSVIITDPDGTEHTYSLIEARNMGYTTEELLSGTARPAMKNATTGYSPTRLSGDFDAKVSLNKNTGKFTVEAPSAALENKQFKDTLSEQLKVLSTNFKINKDYKYNYVDETGTNQEKSIDDIVNDLNAPVKNATGGYNTSSLKYMALAAANIEAEKKAHKNVNGVDLTDEDVIKMNTVAIGPDVKVTSRQLISDLPEAAWLRNIGSYDKATGTAEYGDIMSNAYNKEKVSSEDMIKLWAALEDYFAKGNYSDKEQYMKNVATAKFLSATQPNMSWIRDVTENVRGFLDGIGGYATDLGTAGMYSVEELFYRIFMTNGEDPSTYFELYGEDYGDIYIKRGGNQWAGDMPNEKVDAKIGRVVFDADGVPTYQEERISGGVAEPKTLIQYLRAVFKENQAVIIKDMEYLHASQAGWTSVGYLITELAALISAGNALSKIFTNSVLDTTLKVGAQIDRAADVIKAKDFAKASSIIFSSGTTLNFGNTAKEAAMIIDGMKTIYDIATVVGKAADLVKFVATAGKFATATNAIFGLVGESLAEAVVGDPNRLVDLLNRNDISADDQSYLIQTYIGNALGWGVGLGVGKFLIGAGDTVKGRAISANLSRRIFKIQNAVGDAFDRALLTVRRVGRGDLEERVKALYEKGGKFAKKQANAIAASMKLREMRSILSDMDSIKIIGKSNDEIEEALREVEMKINVLRGAENSLTSMQRQGVDIVQGWLKDPGSGLKAVTEDFYAKAAKVAELERKAGDAFKPLKGAVNDVTNGKVLHLFSQTTTNYIKATEKIDFIYAYVNKYKHASNVTQEILRKVAAYEEELPELRKMVRKFLQSASPELKEAANNFIDADRKWWSRFESLRARLNLTSDVELRGLRSSGLWGSGGELYARTTRKADLSEYVVRHRDGASNVQTFASYENYMAGATGDFADPMGEMQIALYDAGSKQAYRSFAREYNAITGSLTTVVSGEDVEFAKKMKTLETTYFNNSEQLLKGMAEQVQASRPNAGIEGVVKNLKLKVQQSKDMGKAKKAMDTAAAKLQGQLNTVNADNAGRFISYLNAEDTTDLWNEFYTSSVREFLEFGGEGVPDKTRKYIFAQAKDLGLTLPNGTTTVEAYDAVNKALSNSAQNYDKIMVRDVDMVFENKVKRSIMSENKTIANDTRVQTYLSEQRRIAYEASAETFLAERTWEYKQLAEEYGVTAASLDAAGRETIEGYVSEMTRKGSGSRATIDELCKYYGLEGDENAVRYFALSAFMDDQAKYKKELYANIREAVRKEHPEFADADNDRIAKVLTNGIASGIEEEYNNAYLVVKELNPEAVHEASETIMSKVEDIMDDIEGAEANRYAGEKNIIAMRNMSGQVEYYVADPLLARLMNFHYAAHPLNGLSQALYNTNYLWAKLFRLGTTAINLKSMMSQSFRDPINMFLGTGSFRTMRQSLDDISDVIGDDVVNWLKTFEPEALAQLQKTAAETGEDISTVIAKRELAIGKAIAPGATETSMYKSLATAKKARFNGVIDIYDDTAGDKFIRGIDKVGDTLGYGNEWRETTLRNVSYANGLSRALKRGYSLDEARKYAEFVMNEATTNFTRMTNHLVSLKDTVPYFGSAVNGAKSFYKLLSMDPVGVIGRLTGGIIIPAMALTAYSLMDEENRKIYKNIPEYQKEDALVFVVGGQIISIPMPQEIGSFIAPFRQIIEEANGVSTNTFSELVWNNILGFSPIDLTGFVDLDFAKLEQSSPGFLDRINRGISKMWAQLAPAPLKSGLEIVTGVDPYTGRAIDKSRLDYDENGNPIVKDYQSGKLAKALNDMFHSWGWETSAPVIQNILSNIFGQASVDIVDFAVSLAEAVPNGGLNWSVDAEALRSGEGYNPFYVLGQRIMSPITVEAYDEAQSAWKSEVAKLYTMKEEILHSDAWSQYLKAKRSANDPEALKNINASKKNLVEKYFQTIKDTVINLQANYGEQFTAAKYATVLSLMTMNEQTLDAGSYGNYLNTEEFKTARAQAIQTMINLGFPSSSDKDILGKFITNSKGDIEVRTYSPLAILQLDDTSGGKISTNSNRQHYATIRNILSNSDAYKWRDDYYTKSNEARDNKKWTEVERLKNEYDEKIIKLIKPYVEQYGAESVLSNDVVKYLEDWIFVPESDMGKGKYYSSKTGLNKNEGYIKSYLKTVFKYGGNKLNG